MIRTRFGDYYIGQLVEITQQANENGLQVGDRCRIISVDAEDETCHICRLASSTLISNIRHPLCYIKCCKREEHHDSYPVPPVR